MKTLTKTCWLNALKPSACCHHYPRCAHNLRGMPRTKALKYCFCGTRVRCADLTSKRWREGLCIEHWKQRCEEGRARSAEHLRELNADSGHQRTAVKAEWTLKDGVSAGRFQDPGCIYIVKANHWVNSGCHVHQGVGGHVDGGPLSVATCQLKLRQRLNKDFPDSNELRRARAYVVVLGAVRPEPASTNLVGHDPTSWKDNVTSRGLAAFRAHELLDPCQAALKYPHRSDIGKVSRKKKKLVRGK